MLNDIFNILLPQTTIVLFLIILLITGMFVSPKFYKYSKWVSITGIVSAIILLSTVQTEPQYFGFRNSIMSDSYTLLFHFLILACGFLFVLISSNLIKSVKRHAFTFYAVLLTALLGAMNIVSANDFLTLFVSMELLGFSTYFLIASSKGYNSKEASFKYLITSAVSTALFLFGVSYLYGITGSINFSDIYEYVSDNDVSVIYSLSSIMVVAGLSSKLAVFPFANWIPDVYKGCETSVLAFISTVPKLALFGIICRLLVFPLSGSFELAFMVAIAALITAFWANTYALKEKNVKVILACSSAANASYALLTASLVSVYNLSTVIFYLLCYITMNVACFTYLNIYGDKNPMYVENFKGLFQKSRGMTGAYAISVLALAGIPITSGFVAKIYLFTAIANSGLIFVPFLLVLLILMVLALYYYLKILLPLFEKCDKNMEIPDIKASFSQKFVLIACTIIILAIGIFPERIIELCRFAAYNI